MEEMKMKMVRGDNSLAQEEDKSAKPHERHRPNCQNVSDHNQHSFNVSHSCLSLHFTI